MSRAASEPNRLLRIGVLLAALAIAGAAHSRMDTTARIAQGERFVPRPEHARLTSLGFDAVAADFYWLQAVQILGGALRDTEDQAPLLARLIEVVTSLDPWVGHPYRFGAVWLTESEEMVRWANRLLERGAAYDPLEWRNHYHLGFNQFFYLEEHLLAADTLERAVPLEGSPKYLGSLVARLRSGHYGLETAAAFLARLAKETKDDYARAEYLKSLDEIETERVARMLDRARAAYSERHGRDIASVEDLAGGPGAPLATLPPAHPHFPGFRWEIDEESGQIVSSYYGNRYELHVHPIDRARQERWRAARRAREAG